MAFRRSLYTAQKISRAFSSSGQACAKESYRFVVVGGGAGGLSIASTLCRRFGKGATFVIEPSEPLWTLVGGGIKSFEESVQPMASLMPRECVWRKTKAAEFRPHENIVVTEDGRETSLSTGSVRCDSSIVFTVIKYEFLVVATGLELRFDMVKGLPEALHTPGIGSNYSPNTVQDTWKALQSFKEGNAIFTVPNTPVKCLGAPQKIMYLADAYMRETGVRQGATVMFNSPLEKIFGVKKYAESLMKIVNKRDIKLNFKRNLIEVNADRKEAIFEVLNPDVDTFKFEKFEYSFLHVTPPMTPPECLRGSPISDKMGYVDVDRITMRHKKFDNIFAIGDCANSPNGKTAAAVAGQSGVIKANLFALIDGEPMPAQYDGYTSCPLVTGFGKLILAEFDYNGEPLETFPFDQSKERYSMYYMKRDILPQVYWDGLVKGLWPGVGTVRRTLHLGLRN